MNPTTSLRRTNRFSVRVITLLLVTMIASALSGCATQVRHTVSRSQQEASTPAQLVTRPANASRVTRPALPGKALLPAPKQAKIAPSMLPAASHEGSTLPLDAPTITLTAADADLTEPAPLRSCPPEGTRVLLIGDSLSHGLGPVMARHAKQCGTPFFHKGVIGSHVTQWAQDHWLQPQLNRAQPTVVLVSLGGNDYQRTDPHNVRNAIPRFIDKVQNAGAQLLWISPPTFPFSDKIGVRDMWTSELSTRSNIDIFRAQDLTIPRGSDKIHPDMQGNRELSATLWQWLSNATDGAPTS